MADPVEIMKEVVQPRIDDPVLAVGMLQPAGTWGAFGAGELSGIAGMIMRKAANKKASGLSKSGAFSTKTALIALTADRLYAFNAKPSGRKWKIVDEVGDWARADVQVATAPGKMSTKVVLDVPSTGQHFELEATKIMGADKITTPFLAELTKPAG
jgi:hypothetical protein